MPAIFGFDTGYSGPVSARQWILQENRGRSAADAAPISKPAFAGTTSPRWSEAEAETGHGLVTIEALLVVRVAIFGLGKAVRAERELEAGANADAVQILAFLEVEHGARGAVLIIEGDAGVGIAHLPVEQHVAAHRGADAEIGRAHV